MNRHPAQPALPAICASIAFAVWSSVACAQADVPRIDTVESPAADTPAVESTAMEPAIPRDQLSPVVAGIFAALDEDRARIRQLKVELATTNDPARAFELQRAIVTAKQDAELRMLRIQADHARRENRADVAAELDSAIQALTTPANGHEPAPRAATAAGR